MDAAAYDPFVSGQFPVGVRTVEALDRLRDRLFTCEIWYPAQIAGRDRPAGPDAGRDAAAYPGKHPLIIYSHPSGCSRRAATFLCTHLASHGYVTAALDHSETFAAELAPRDGETGTQRAARIEAVIAGRVPDVRFLLDHLLGGGSAPMNSTRTADIGLDHARVGLVGHSFGGWTVLATTEVEPRVRAVVALAPGGNRQPRPGILPVTLTFAWGRDVPTLYLAAADDVPIPLSDVCDLFDQTPATKRLFVLRRADHQHFLDDVEEQHEALRTMSLPGDAAWIPAAMRPITDLCSGEQAHMFARGLTLAHFDATLRQYDDADQFLAGDVQSELATRTIDAYTYRPSHIQ